MEKLIPIAHIPYRARAAEAAARAKWPTRDMALDAATFEIVDAPGTYSGAWPCTYGWVCTRFAAIAMTEIMCRMPGDSQHQLFRAQENTRKCSDALSEYLEAVARDQSVDGRAAALAAYAAARVEG